MVLLTGGDDKKTAHPKGGTPIGEGTVLLEPINTQVPNQFTQRTTTGAEPTVQTSAMPAGVPARAASGGQVNGSAPGLYGGSGNAAVCDRNQLIAFLEANPAKARAWAGVLGITTAQIRDYVNSLTPVLLTTDTLVLNHGYANGKATPRNAVLQAGTAVLIDKYGIPRVKCGCGNPLLPPTLTKATRIRGPRWSGFQPTKVTKVVSADTVNIFVIVNVTTGELTDRPAGTDGTQDTPVLIDRVCDLFPNDPACTTTTTSSTTLPPFTPPTAAPTSPPNAPPTTPERGPGQQPRGRDRASPRGPRLHVHRRLQQRDRCRRRFVVHLALRGPRHLPRLRVRRDRLADLRRVPQRGDPGRRLGRRRLTTRPGATASPPAERRTWLPVEGADELRCRHDVALDRGSQIGGRRAGRDTGGCVQRVRGDAIAVRTVGGWGARSEIARLAGARCAFDDTGRQRLLGESPLRGIDAPRHPVDERADRRVRVLHDQRELLGALRHAAPPQRQRRVRALAREAIGDGPAGAERGTRDRERHATRARGRRHHREQCGETDRDRDDRPRRAQLRVSPCRAR